MSGPQRPTLGLLQFLVLPFVVAGVVLIGGEELARAAGIVVPDSFSGAVMYATMAAWILHRAPREPYAVDVEALSARPARPSDWTLVWIALPLIAVAAGGYHVLTLAASVVAPRIAEALVAPDADLQGFTLRSVPGDLVETAIGAIAEEWLFRGVLLHLWARRAGVRNAVIATSILFAIFHADVLGSLVFGITMAALYVRAGTLLVPIAVHFVFNAILTVVVLVFGEGPTTVAAYRESWWEGITVLVIGLVVTVPILRRIAPRPWRLPVGRSDGRT